MDAREFATGVLAGRLTRRDLNNALAASGLALAFAPVLPRSGRAASTDHPTVFTWAGLETPEMHGPYIRKYGESPNFAVYGDEEEAFVKLQGGFEADITMPGSYKVMPWHDWWGLTSITYRTDLVDIREESLGLLWDERYKGRLAMFDSLIDGVMIAAIYSGATNPFDMTAEEIAKVRELLVRQRPLLRYYSNSTTDIELALASGEVVAATTWNDSPFRLLERGVPVKFMRPKEGAMSWASGLALMKDADPAKLERTYDFIDAFLSPETGAFWIESLGMGHSNKKSFERVSEDELAKRGLSRHPEEYLNSGVFQTTIRNEAELQGIFEAVKAGL
jgi:spermidine/putrescine transport system substrate-binding protein